MLVSLDSVLKKRARKNGFRLFIEHFSLEVGERVAITGPSGCGKSTMLDILGMLLKPDAIGSFRINLDAKTSIDIAELWQSMDRDTMTKVRMQYMGYVLQTGELLPFLTVRENVFLTASLNSVEHAPEKVSELLEALHISHLSRALPHTLSMGERQRAAIARALASSPKLLLADEPTASLDPCQARNVMRLFLDMAESKGTAVVMVSHDVALVHEFHFREIPITVSEDEGDVTALLSDSYS